MMTNKKNVFYAVIVIYNTNVNKSITLKNLQTITSYQINKIVVDNSTQDMGNRADCKKKGWTYISMNGNAGLSRAYNKALNYIKECDGIVIWFDDDTKVTQEYFDTLNTEAIKHPEVDIFAPMIQGQDGRFWSPNEYHFLKNKQLKSKDQIIDIHRFNAINSCTAVRISVYQDYRYTEKLFLDQVDHQFFEDQRALGRKFEKLDVIIHHNFSTRSKMENIEKVKKRYSVMIPDFLIFCNKSAARYFLGWVKILGWGVREAVRYKTPFFIVWCLKVAYIESKKTRI